MSRWFGFAFVGALRGGAGESAVSACACISDTRVYPISGSVPAHHWHVCALVSVCVCVCVNENDGEKHCYAEMNERNDMYISKSRKKATKKQSNCGAQCSFCGAVPHSGPCMGNTAISLVFNNEPAMSFSRGGMIVHIVELDCSLLDYRLAHQCWLLSNLETRKWKD